MPHTFPSPYKPLDPAEDGCRICHIGGLLGFADGYWWCYDHFYHKDGPGARWPRRAQRLVRRVMIDDAVIPIIERYTKEAMLGGKSTVREPASRKTNLAGDQLIGQMGNYAINVFIYGKEEGLRQYQLSRDEALRRTKAGLKQEYSDVPGEMIDVKTSAMRAGGDPWAYNLVVRPAEYHVGMTYFLGLVPREREVVLLGWELSGSLPAPGLDPRFGDAHVLPAIQLRSIKEFNERRRREDVPLVHERSRPEGDQSPSPEADRDEPSEAAD